MPNQDLYDFALLSGRYPHTPAGLTALLMDPSFRARFPVAESDDRGRLRLTPHAAVIVWYVPAQDPS